MIKIRLAHTSEAQLIALLGRITFIQSHSQYIKNDKDVKDFCDASFLVSKIKKELANQNILFWIILYDELPVGFAKVILHKKNEFIKAKNVCQLDKIYILNDFLGMKLGNTLHSTIINHVKQLKFDAIWLVTYIYNYNAIQFYESREYQKVGAIDFIVAEKGYKNHILMKNLNE